MRFGRDSLPRWRQSIERAKRRQVDSGTHRLYQWIVAWMLFISMLTTIQQMMTGSMPAVQGWVILPGALLFGGALIVWMRRRRTPWALTPDFVAGSLFELSAVFSVGQVAVSITACIGAAMAPGRPWHTTAVIAACTGASLVLALTMVSYQRRR
ncbi:MAG: hypothetical protein ABI382_07625 [Nakamurella sp.]